MAKPSRSKKAAVKKAAAKPKPAQPRPTLQQQLQNLLMQLPDAQLQSIVHYIQQLREARGLRDQGVAMTDAKSTEPTAMPAAYAPDEQAQLAARRQPGPTGEEALADPTPIATQGPEVIAPPKPPEEPELALDRARAEAAKASKASAEKPAASDEDEELSGGEKARRRR